ncbi:hypothetical protein JH06_0535 [Blastocystis sp. subtype 4]|uniref:hypothetical protein n=1 Tax=Blastocystis sp. subtype 4 TaxID=944170 RepID=UPI0007118918|nr:hypothetical protein JH06_0535 [Blastocystis sp. subtype 4]KNB45859.1 hypothetical protein JH06_0535 [Blastocystis sp. subtype 4]|eukprot:XP_014529302.1 hypothetical protein JH06_0535 [Blastocystis sp. subtype 4]
MYANSSSYFTLDEEGFLVNGNYYRGGVLAFNDLVLLWDVNSIDELTPESLQAVTLFNPPINMLFVGTGKITSPLPSSVVDYLHKHNISVESMSTSAAAANFNFLHDDKQRVAAALIPEQPSEKVFES